MDPLEERGVGDRDKRVVDASVWKERGNAHYGRKEFVQASQAYQAGLDVLEASTDSSHDNHHNESHEDVKDRFLEISIPLRSNLAMTLLKMQEFSKADQVCSRILSEDPLNAKVLYRRALAREGFNRNTSLPLSDQKSRYLMAMDDLQKCLHVIDEKQKSNSTQPSEISKMKKSARITLDRLETAYRFVETEEQRQHQEEGNDHQQPMQDDENSRQSNGSGSTMFEKIPKATTASNNASIDASMKDANPSADHYVENSPPLAPPITQQKQDVMRLLMARQPAGTSLKGEAFFLMDWKWWCRWCRQVDFFYDSSTNSLGTDPKEEKSQVERIKWVLKLLPAGAILPISDNSGGNSSDDDDSSSEEGNIPEGSLGPIDNSRLLLDRSVFHQNWFSKDSENPLHPNLVRGYHYELLPREVYSALRTWYGEVTPSLCRRTSSNGMVPLYRLEKYIAKSFSRCAVAGAKCSACRAVGATARCKRCMSVQYCDRGCQEAHWPYHKVLCKQASSNGTKIARNEQICGRVGLNNLGNTCFMNSALQSLSHAAPLTRHFLSNKFRADVNSANPLGTGGKLALAYDSVLKELWMRSRGAATSPTALKRAIALFAPRFAGCLQHDAQEFLAYLLDGLHEDLNRIRKAPYVEMPDVTDGQNMAIAGAEAWDAHKRRNDSLVLDSFYGQFQSTCICPQCRRVSVSFDAFNHVSLEIPQIHKLTVTVPILVFRKPSAKLGSASRTPYRYGVTLHRQCLVADLKASLVELTGIPATHLIMTDIYDNSIYEILRDKKPVSSIRPNDVIAAYEVEPYSNATIHVVATHCLLVKGKNGKEQRPLFGFPLMSSFDAQYTCRQAWEHVWDIVGNLVEEEGSREGFVDTQNSCRRADVLRIRVVNSQGQAIPVFSTEEGVPSSILPSNTDEKLSNALGGDCTENFLFLSLEWKNPPAQENTMNPNKFIQPQSFLSYLDHPSLIDALQKQRANSLGDRVISLDQCFENFTKPERLDEHNKWYCSKCKEHVRAMKTMKLWRLPNILVIHLKRFEFKHALRRDKLDTFVDFPLEGLSMNRHCANLDRLENKTNLVDASIDAEYDLFAVINHYGRMGFGHYTAFCRQWDKDWLSSEWNLFDDSSVRSVDASEIIGPAAYVLFYRRRRFN